MLSPQTGAFLLFCMSWCLCCHALILKLSPSVWKLLVLGICSDSSVGTHDMKNERGESVHFSVSYCNFFHRSANWSFKLSCVLPTGPWELW
jgi:hypothetical protein